MTKNKEVNGNTVLWDILKKTQRTSCKYCVLWRLG